MAYGLKIDINEDDSCVTAIVVDRDDNGREIARRDFSASRVHDSLLKKVGLYGLSKLLQDRTSDKSVKELGEGKLDEMEAILARFESGEWASERKPGAPTVSAEIEALAALKNTSVAAIQKTLRGFSKEQREGMFKHPAVAEKAAEIKAARAAAEEVDLSDFA